MSPAKKSVRRFSYADVYVTEKRRVRVAFNGKVSAAEVLKLLQAEDFYDITDEESLEFLSVDRVEPADEED